MEAAARAQQPEAPQRRPPQAGEALQQSSRGSPIHLRRVHRAPQGQAVALRPRVSAGSPGWVLTHDLLSGDAAAARSRPQRRAG